MCVRRAPAGPCQEIHSARFSAHRRSFSCREIHRGWFSAHSTMHARVSGPRAEPTGAARRASALQRRRARRPVGAHRVAPSACVPAAHLRACPPPAAGLCTWSGNPRDFCTSVAARWGRGASFRDFCTSRAAIRRGRVPCDGGREGAPRRLRGRGLRVSAGQGPPSSRGLRPRRRRGAEGVGAGDPGPVPRPNKSPEKMHWSCFGMPQAYKSPENVHRWAEGPSGLRPCGRLQVAGAFGPRPAARNLHQSPQVGGGLRLVRSLRVQCDQQDPSTPAASPPPLRMTRGAFRHPERSGAAGGAESKDLAGGECLRRRGVSRLGREHPGQGTPPSSKAPAAGGVLRLRAPCALRSG